MGLNLGGNASQGVRAKEDGGWYTTTTGYYWRKNMVKGEPNVFVDTKVNFHYVISSLGEMYMNLAEAYLLKGDVAKAVEMLNVTRMQHGGLPAPRLLRWMRLGRITCVNVVWKWRMKMETFIQLFTMGKYGGACNYGRASGDVIKY